jgi:sulfatase modifying factor 1
VGGPCCAPSSGRVDDRAPTAIAPGEGTAPDLVRLDGGVFAMGSDDRWAYPEDGEGPVVDVEVDAFSVGAYAVTNDDFARFVDATHHVTDAERFGWSFVFGGLLRDDFPPTEGVLDAPWWRKVGGASWRHPEGAGSGIDERVDHPVVHVSWNDANAYAAWTRTRLPSEAEWELAARGGLQGKAFPWGDELEPGGEHRMNVWQGAFPAWNSAEDGFVGTAPVSAFPPNGFGLHNATGNVWEWTADRSGMRGVTAWGREGRVQKGGSYLCQHSYCRRYRVAARQASTPDSSSGNVGFRCARDA